MKVKTNFIKLFDEKSPLKLENGAQLDEVNVAYQTYGKLNSEGTNAILVCHALTGNAHAAGFLDSLENDNNSKPDLVNKYSKIIKDNPGWWDSLIGPHRTIDTNKYFVICPNILGSCYGTTGPTSISPKLGHSYNMQFPVVSVRDMVKVQKKLIDQLNVNKLEMVIGGSLGGMQVLEWAVMFPELVKSIVPIATAARHSAWAVGFNELQRSAIMSDPAWNKGNYKNQPSTGLANARKIAMISYRTQASFEKKFGRERTKSTLYYKPSNSFQIQNYLVHQGKKLVERFDTNAYIYLTYAMDLYDLSYDRDKLGSVLNNVSCKSLCIGINSDILYPATEQKEIAILLQNSKYAEINSIHGHDAFLIEFDQLDKIITDFIHTL